TTARPDLVLSLKPADSGELREIFLVIDYKILSELAQFRYSTTQKENTWNASIQKLTAKGEEILTKKEEKQFKKKTPNDKKADELIEGHKNNILPWSRYTKASLKKQCSKDNIDTTEMTIKQMQDKIGELKPKINTTYINFVDLIYCMNTLLFPVLTSQNVSEEIAWLMQILDFAKTCGRNEIVLRVNDAVMKQKSGDNDGNDSGNGNYKQIFSFIKIFF
ncbi:hypothetical protein RFI_37124, partial [Reticulomyxa filosa]